MKSSGFFIQINLNSVDDTKITRGTIQCLWHEEYRIQNLD